MASTARGCCIAEGESLCCTSMDVCGASNHRIAPCIGALILMADTCPVTFILDFSRVKFHPVREGRERGM